MHTRFLIFLYILIDWLIRIQGGIQDFRTRGRQPSSGGGGGRQHTISPIFLKICMKSRKFWAVRGAYTALYHTTSLSSMIHIRWSVYICLFVYLSYCFSSSLIDIVCASNKSPGESYPLFVCPSVYLSVHQSFDFTNHLFAFSVVFRMKNSRD